MAATIKCTLNSRATIEGTVFAVDPVTQSIVIKDSEGSYHVVNPSHIEKLEGDLSKFSSPAIADLGISVANLEKQEVKALDAAERSLASLNSSVSADVQTLFDRISFIFPSAWLGSSIVVLNEFIIDPPYDQVRYKDEVPNSPSSTAASGMSRLIKVLEGERKKLKM